MQPANKRLVTEAAVPAHIENEVTTPGTPTQAALSATYATRASAPFTINSADANGNPTSITYHLAGGDLTTTYTYGTNGIATETTAGQTITYTYDAAGNMTGAA